MKIRAALYRDDQDYHFMAIKDDNWDTVIQYQVFKNIDTYDEAKDIIDDVILQITQISNDEDVFMSYYILHPDIVNHYSGSSYSPNLVNVKTLEYAQSRFSKYGRIKQKKGFPKKENFKKYKKGFIDLKIWKRSDKINLYRLFIMAFEAPEDSSTGLKNLWKIFNKYQSMKSLKARDEYQEWLEAL